MSGLKPLRWSLRIGTLAVAAINALPSSPYFDPLLFWLGRLVGTTWAGAPIVFHGTSALIFVATLCGAALPAVIGRWFAPSLVGPNVGALVRLVAASLLAWPALWALASGGN